LGSLERGDGGGLNGANFMVIGVVLAELWPFIRFVVADPADRVVVVRLSYRACGSGWVAVRSGCRWKEELNAVRMV
jgi:hypothetical protein